MTFPVAMILHSFHWTVVLLLQCVLIPTNVHAQPIAGVWDAAYQLFGRGYRPHTPPSQPEALKLIGAGLPRTGTGSLHTALELLGFHTYHMVKVMQNATHAAAWAAAARDDKAIAQVWDLLAADGYNATLDYPAADYFGHALERYPNAKVILTVRDNVTIWAKSYQTLNRLVRTMDAPFSWFFPNPAFVLWPQWAADMHEMRCAMGRQVLGWKHGQLYQGDGLDTNWLEEQYQRHVQAVQDSVPPHQLLVFNVKQGWEPLCAFLEVPVPTGIPFPYKGETTMLRRIHTVYRIVTYTWIPILALITLGMGWWLARWHKVQRKRKEKED